MSEELDAPLGRPKKNRRKPAGGRRGKPIANLPIARMLFGIVAVLLLVVAGRVLFVHDPQGGRPVAEVGISTGETTNQIASNAMANQPAPEKSTPTASNATEGGPAITIVGDDVPSGTTRGGDGVDVAALNEFGVRPNLMEQSPNGPIPIKAANGETPFSAYGRASVTPNGAAGKPLVAIVVTGMGLSESGTLDAIDKLPDNVTLAFAPYGRTLARTTAAARSGGHELFLEIPLEPFDYPDNDPGPQTLLTGQPPRANLDRLFWLMGRMGGYAGVVNYMGARFTASPADFGPVMEEIGTRGLGYIDDGTSNRSIAGSLARNDDVPFRRADIELDATPTRTAILKALSELEQKARDKGSALGIASALPVSVQTIAEWAQKLDDEDLLLVPASALMSAS